LTSVAASKQLVQRTKMLATSLQQVGNFRSLQGSYGETCLMDFVLQEELRRELRKFLGKFHTSLCNSAR